MLIYTLFLGHLYCDGTVQCYREQQCPPTVLRDDQNIVGRKNQPFF